MGADSDAYTQLLSMAARSQRVTRPLLNTQKPLRASSATGIGFSLHGGLYVSPMTEVSEILPIPRYTSIPGVLPWIWGIANVRGRLLPLMDLTLFLFNEVSSQPMRRRRILVIEKEKLYSGFIVDEVLGMQHFEQSHYSTQARSMDPAIQRYIQGAYRHTDKTHTEKEWQVFSPHQLMDDPRFLKVGV